MNFLRYVESTSETAPKTRPLRPEDTQRESVSRASQTSSVTWSRQARPHPKRAHSDTQRESVSRASRTSSDTWSRQARPHPKRDHSGLRTHSRSSDTWSRQAKPHPKRDHSGLRTHSGSQSVVPRELPPIRGVDKRDCTQNGTTPAKGTQRESVSRASRTSSDTWSRQARPHPKRDH